MRISANAQARRGVSANWKALRAEGINPRTNKPFARGGAYNTSGEKADSAAKLLAKAAAAAAKAGVAEAANKVASTEVRDLKQQVLDLKRQLLAAEESVELKVNNAKLEGIDVLMMRTDSSFIPVSPCRPFSGATSTNVELSTVKFNIAH